MSQIVVAKGVHGHGDKVGEEETQGVVDEDVHVENVFLAFDRIAGAFHSLLDGGSVHLAQIGGQTHEGARIDEHRAQVEVLLPSY